MDAVDEKSGVEPCQGYETEKGAATPVSVSEIADGTGPKNTRADGGGNSESGKEYIKGWKLVAVLAAVTIASFLMMVDVSIVATATPRITSDFHSLNDIGWYGSAYQLANAALQPLTGKLFSYFSSKWTFLSLFALFELGSLLCGVATSSTMLIVGRAVAGMGGSGIMSGGLMVIAGAVPLHKRPLLTGIMIGLCQLGVVCGPLVGGALTEYVTWRWCFYINLPVGALVAGLIFLLNIPEQAEKPRAGEVARDLYRRLDLPGFALLAPAAIQLLLALEFGGKEHRWVSSVVIGLFCGSAATFVVFMWWNARAGADGLLPVAIVRQTPVWTGALSQGCLIANSTVLGYFLPVYFQSVRDATPFQSGIYLLPIILSQLLFAVLSGWAVGKIGRIVPPAIAGSVAFTVGSGLLSLLSPTSSTGEWVGYQILVGIGRGIAFQMPLIAVQNGLPPADISMGLSVLVFAQNMVSSVFLVVANTIFGNSLRSELATLPPTVDAGAVFAAGATALRKVVRPEDVPGVVQAYTLSVDRTFYLAAAIGVLTCACSWGLGWKDVRKKKVLAETARRD